VRNSVDETKFACAYFACISHLHVSETSRDRIGKYGVSATLLTAPGLV
jgi:hypothetical protein